MEGWKIETCTLILIFYVFHPISYTTSHTDGGYPPQGDPAYPGFQQQGYPVDQQPAGYAPPPTGYPPAQQQYPPPQQQQPGPGGGYPPQQGAGYPPPGGGYPPQQGGYPAPGPPPGTAAYQAGGQQVMVMQPTSTTVVVQQQVYSDKPAQCECPNCHNQVTSVVNHSSGTFAWIMCVVMFLCG